MPFVSLVPTELFLRLLLLLLSNKKIIAPITASNPTATPTPMPAFAPPLRDELVLLSGFAIAVGDAIEPEDEFVVELPLVEELAEVPIPVDEDDTDVVGIKSTMVIVRSLSSSGAGASKVLLTSVEHGVSGWQQAHVLLVVLYVRFVR
jgi:hypothetical protein